MLIFTLENQVQQEVKVININVFKKEIQDLFGSDLCKVQTNPEFRKKFANEINTVLQNENIKIKIIVKTIIQSFIE